MRFVFMNFIKEKIVVQTILLPRSVMYKHNERPKNYFDLFQINTCNTCRRREKTSKITKKKVEMKPITAYTYYLYIQYSYRHKLSSFIFEQINRYNSKIITLLCVLCRYHSFYDILSL